MGFLRDYGAGYVAAFGGLAVVLVVGSALMPQAGSGAVLSPDLVVARVQTDGEAYPHTLRDAMVAQRAAPGDLALAQAAARALIDVGRERGDSRLVGAAVGVLRPFLAQPSGETLYLAATARQYQHDFDGALDLLDQALAMAPNDLNARLSRATILTVVGDYPAAREDCAGIAGARPDIGFLCQATTEVLTPNGPGYAARLQAILAQPGVLDASLHGWAHGLVAEIKLHNGDRETARVQFQAVLEANPLALRERMLLADMKTDDGEAQASLDLLKSSPETDGVLIRRVLALRALGEMDEADRLAAVLDQRFRLNLDLGLTAHAREEALYFLTIADDPAQALARAEVNWALQHEIEDADLLLRAAEAAGRPAAAAPVREWMATNGVHMAKK
ncbi:MAG: tetratricopeptide repeat protein [Paracoccaceae bacterium]